MAKIILDSDYFGDESSFFRFVKDFLEEVEQIDRNGRKKSKAPERFLGDCYPSLNTLKMVFEDVMKKKEKELEKFQFQTGKEAKY